MLGETATVSSEDWTASTDRYLAEPECVGGVVCVRPFDYGRASGILGMLRNRAHTSIIIEMPGV